jgi:hypothetical protein
MSTSTRGRTLVVNDEAIVRAMPMLLRASVSAAPSLTKRLRTHTFSGRWREPTGCADHATKIYRNEAILNIPGNCKVLQCQSR